MRSLRIKFLTLSVLLLVVCVGSGKAQEAADDTPIKVNTVLLNVPVVVSDKDGRRIAGLKKEDFSILQAGEKQAIEFFEDAEAPMNVAILIDTSGSTTGILSSIKKAARFFLLNLNSEDKAIIASFDGSINILSKLTSDQKKLKNAIDDVATINPIGGNMYDAMYQVITKDFVEAKGRKAIIILSDGFDTGRKISFEKMLGTLVESDTVVYSILFLTQAVTPFLPKNAKTTTLNDILITPPLKPMKDFAIASGGRVYIADAGDFQGAFQKIVDELRKQYLVGFYPTEAGGGKSLPIRISVERKDVTVRTKGTIKLKTPNQ